MSDTVPPVPAPLVPGSKMTMRDFFRCEARLRAQRSRLPDPEAAQICGLALRQIRDEEGWRMYRHASFEEYLAKDWFGWTLAEAQALIAAVVDEEVTQPTTELAQRQLVEAMGNLFDEAGPPETPEEVDAELRAAGHDPDAVATRMAAAAATALITQEESMNTQPRNTQINLSAISPSRWQPRTAFDAAELLTLADSIRRHGLLVPLTVFARPEGGYELLAGERRVRATIAWTAFRQDGDPNLDLAGWVDFTAKPSFWEDLDNNIVGIQDRIAGAFIDAKVLPGDDLLTLHQMALVETLQRVDLTPLERAQAVNDLMVAGEYTQSQVAEILGITQPTVSKWLSILDLAPAVQEKIIRRGISPTAAQAIARVPEAAQAALATRVQQLVDAGDDEAATKRQVNALATKVRKFLDPARYVVPADRVVGPPRRNLLRLLHYAFAHLPAERVGELVAGYVDTDNYYTRYLRRDPLKMESYDATKILARLLSLDGANSYWEAVAGREGWTCAACQLRALEDLRPSAEGLEPYCRRGQTPSPTGGPRSARSRGGPGRGADDGRVTCDRWVGPDDPLVIPLEYQVRQHWPGGDDVPECDDCGAYVADLVRYRQGYAAACKAAARAAQEQAQAQRRAHVPDMDDYQTLLDQPWVQRAHPLAHACEKCAHHTQCPADDPAAPEGIPCRYAAEPLADRWGQGTRAPRYGVLVRDDGVACPRCEMFRYAEVPDLTPDRVGWRFPDRGLAFGLLAALYATADREVVPATLGWLPYGRPRDKCADEERLLRYVRQEWNALGGDNAVATLLQLALEESAIIRHLRGYGRGVPEGYALRSPGGEAPQRWQVASLTDVQQGRRPYGWPEDWPCPWVAEAEGE